MKNFKQYIFTILFLTVSSLINGQGWLQTYNPNDEGKEIIVDVTGGYGLLSTQSLKKIAENGSEIWFFPKGGERLIQSSDSSFVFTNRLNANDFEVTKIDPNGNLVWEITVTGFNFFNPVRILPIVESEEGGFVIAAYSNEEIYLVKISAGGNLLWNKVIVNEPGISKNAIDLVETQDHGLAILSDYSASGPIGGPYLIKADSSGNFLWEIELSDSLSSPRALIETIDGGFAIAGTGFNNQFPAVHLPTCVLKLDHLGTELWQQTIYPNAGYGPTSLFTVLSDFNTGRSIIEKPNGDLFTYAIVYEGDQNGNNEALGWGIANPGLVKIDPSGVTYSVKEILRTPFHYEFPTDLTLNDEGEFILCGDQNTFSFAMKLDTNGNLYSNLIFGNIAHDLDADCLIGMGDNPLEGWVVQAAGANTSYGTTDSLGNYDIRVDSGSYLLSIITPSPYWASCEDSLIWDFPGFYDTLAWDFPVQSVVECPYLTVDISTPFLRRCFDNTYYLNYCNDGTESADSVYVEVHFDTFLTIVSSSVPWSTQNGNNYVFEVGDLSAGECGTISISTTLDCDSTVLGQTHCVEAHIFPDSLCIPPNVLWSGASITVEGECQGDSIHFEIKNIGTDALDEMLEYIVIEDDMILSPGSVPLLGPGGSFNISFPATGGTFRLEAEQVTYHPGSGTPIAVVEGCGGFGSTGFVTVFSDGDNDPFISIDCQENIGSFDPNDKQGFPKGYGVEKYIEANTDLEYLIRFQNTGTDTAFTVSIIDSISPLLDISTIKPGASSHNYHMEFLDGNAILFQFDNIQLPDSNTNEPLSHGFVKFRIAQQRNNPIGSIIQNAADIYFDFNDPVRTNQTTHTIGKDFILVNIDPVPELKLQEIQVYPNPFSESARFELHDLFLEDGRFELYSLNGSAIQSIEFSGGSFEFNRNGMDRGLFIFVVKEGSSIVGRGKIVIQ